MTDPATEDEKFDETRILKRTAIVRRFGSWGWQVDWGQGLLDWRGDVHELLAMVKRRDKQAEWWTHCPVETPLIWEELPESA